MDKLGLLFVKILILMAFDAIFLQIVGRKVSLLDWGMGIVTFGILSLIDTVYDASQKK